MTVSLKHKFTSAKADGADATKIKPSNWNDEHDLLITGPALVGKDSAGSGAAGEIAVDASLTLTGGTLAVATPYTAGEQTKLAGVEAGAQANTVTSVSGKSGAVTLAKDDVGLGSVDNTADADKPVSTAQAAAIAAGGYTHPATHPPSIIEQDASNRFVTDVEKADWNAKQAAGDYATNSALTTHTVSANNPHAVTKAQVGLASVDNTADADKPVSTAQAAADAVVLASAATDATAKASQLGTFATAAALEAAKPAASNAGKTAQVGSAAPYSQYVSDGTTWLPVATYATDASGNVMGQVSPNGQTYGVPYILAQSAIPRILPSSGSSNATGLITFTTALPYSLDSGQPCFVYMPAGVVTAGSQGSGAGVYEATGLGTNNTVQISGDGVVTANGAYTQTTDAYISLANILVPSGAVGPNGGIEVSIQFGFLSSVNTKYASIKVNGAAIVSPAATTSSAKGLIFILKNSGSLFNQAFTSGWGGLTDTSGANRNNFNLSGDSTLTFDAKLTNTNDYIYLNFYEIQIHPGA